MKQPPPRRQSGIALLEAMIAIVILGVGLLGTVGLQARAYSALSDAGMRAEATIAGEKLLGIMTSDLSNLGGYQLADGAQPNAQMQPWVQETRSHIPDAQLTVATAPGGGASLRVDVTIGWQRKAKEERGVHRVTFYVSN